MSKTYKCEGCGGLLSFDPETQSLKCEYCKSIFHFTGETRLGVLKQPYSGALTYKQEEDSKHIYECANCHTKMANNQDVPITRCVSCGSKDLAEVQGTGVHPMAVIPFKISRKKAAECFADWLSTRKFAPNDLKKMAKLQKMSGFYAPVYSFDLTAVTEYSAEGITKWKDKDGKEHSSSKYVSGTESEDYVDYIVSASNSIDSDIYAEFDGYKTASAVGYSSEYLLGFTGVNTDFDVHKGYRVLNQRISKHEEERINRMLSRRFDDVDHLRTNTTIRNVLNCYYYAPIWANHYKYKNKDYHCYVNGQTGKVCGKSPKSVWKILGLVLGIITWIAFVGYLLSR